MLLRHIYQVCCLNSSVQTSIQNGTGSRVVDSQPFELRYSNAAEHAGVVFLINCFFWLFLFSTIASLACVLSSWLAAYHPRFNYHLNQYSSCNLNYSALLLLCLNPSSFFWNSSLLNLTSHNKVISS